MPFRKTLIKSVRKELVGAVAEGNWDRNTPATGLVDWSTSANVLSLTRGIEFVLVVQLMTTVNQGHAESGDCVQAPPDRPPG
jgi:hypothetical protein